MHLPGMGAISKLTHQILEIHLILRITQDKVDIMPGRHMKRLLR